MVPTTPYDAVWYGVTQWMGVTDEDELDEVLPNRHSFGDTLFDSETLFGTLTSPSPTISPAPSTTVAPPSNEPTASSNSPTAGDVGIIEIDWQAQPYAPLTVSVGDTVRFNWSGFHNGTSCE